MMGALGWPCVFIAPGVSTHHEKADRLFVVYAVRDAADVAVHPAQNQFVVIDCGAGAKLALAGARLFLAAVRPRTDDGARARVLVAMAFFQESVEIRRGAIWAVCFVVPAGNI